MSDTGLNQLEQQGEALSDSLGDAAGMAATFDAELRRVRAAFAATGKDAETLERGMSKGLRRAFDGVVFDGMKLSDALDTMAQSMIQTTYSAAIKPVTSHVGGLLSDGVGKLMSGILPFADGAAFSQGRVMPFAKGGIVSGPVSFPMRGGTGLMGEAGPEAILPLTRGADGALGVRSQGGRATSVVMNIQTPDVQGFQRSQGQIAAQLSRALSRGNRNR
ncbi:phage tail tape measure protein [Phaeobacter inhibens]|uniref:phage tail tape measure protein n=1 Tax=Phaeobacter inhibens TaxID=221822 RepID=UPI000C9CDEC5|nr:phage tail tape measure protein [Phaeobacter inhibens]AUQ62804.1 putative gene transfer agent tail tape measure protein [Phaeobacter inhibens]AUQ66357.1 putative gene transfer agent tail tape measure protein [Phaeobacter inhibens]AUQ82707.1 putative gene transfer agent tail tape measure protein [Phaeobacter inhibens]AUQ90468.1 putative gene transfer agent tail tape measure protein [Phaeobacter inhibens]AUR07992.1 putative gene transfer agent tail tape measure protein [Phaeobacter inhibens]